MKYYYNSMPKAILIILILAICLSFVPNIEDVRYCVGNSLHENISVQGNVIHLELKECPFGCLDNITASGADCSAPDVTNVVIGFGLIIFIIFVIYSLPRVLKKKGKR